MKKTLILLLVCFVAACSFKEEPAPQPIIQQETYPYGMTEKEWNELSIKDKAKIRRDFYFYEKGHTKFVNPELEIEGIPDTPSWKKPQPVQPSNPASLQNY